MQETLRGVPSPLRFGDREATTDYTGGCVKPLTDSGFTGQVEPDLTYKADTSKVGDEGVRAYFAAIASYWRKRSAQVRNETTPDGMPDMVTVHPFHDRYRLFVSYYAPSHLIELGGVLDDCIWRYGTPEPGDDP